MNIMLICSAEGPMPDMAYTGDAYREARRRALDCREPPRDLKALKGGDRRVYVSSAPAALSSAEALCPGCEPVIHVGLDEAFGSGAFPNAALPLSLRAFLERPRGSALADARSRAEALAALLTQEGRDCVLISHPAQIPQLMDALRRRGYCFNRSNLGAIRPLERILATSRTAHCGGCGHNCMLSNPGCDIGRDKAQCAGIPFKK